MIHPKKITALRDFTTYLLMIALEMFLIKYIYIYIYIYIYMNAYRTPKNGTTLEDVNSEQVTPTYLNHH